jgi:hypothetical protein
MPRRWRNSDRASELDQALKGSSWEAEAAVSAVRRKLLEHIAHRLRAA